MSDDDAYFVGYLAGRLVHIIDCGSLDEARITARDAIAKLIEEDFDDPEGQEFLKNTVRRFDLELEGAA